MMMMMMAFFFMFQLSAVSPGLVSSVVAPVLLKYRVCRARLLLAGSRAEVDPAADVALLHGEVLLIEDSARQYSPIGGELIFLLLCTFRLLLYTEFLIPFFLDTDRRYRATEKLLYAEEEYRECLCSARELYAKPLERNYPQFHDVIFQPLADLAKVSADLCQRVSLCSLLLTAPVDGKPARLARASGLPVDRGTQLGTSTDRWS